MSAGTILLIVVMAVIVYSIIRKNRKTSTSEVLPYIARLGGTGRYEFDIVGESKYQDALERICGGRTEDGANDLVDATLYQEDSNPHDSQAVRVDIEGLTVGYLSRDDAHAYRKQLDALGQGPLVAVCKAKIVGGWQRGKSDRGHFGVKLDLPVI